MKPARCKEHPENKQFPGVCSSCLREKLSRLDPIPSNQKSLSSFDLSISYDFSAEPSSSNYVSHATYHSQRHHRNSSMDSSMSYSNMGLDYGLKKSRSMVVDSRNEVGGGSYEKKKDGFWSKLLKLTRKGTKNVLKHSLTVREGRGR